MIEEIKKSPEEVKSYGLEVLVWQYPRSVDLSKIGEVSRRRPGRDTCANVRKYDGKQGEVSFELSKIGEELEDDGLDGIETYFPDFESFNAYFPDFTAFNYKAETFNENDWPEFDVIE
jgi:hypothetical protein